MRIKPEINSKKNYVSYTNTGRLDSTLLNNCQINKEMQERGKFKNSLNQMKMKTPLPFSKGILKGDYSYESYI